MNTENKVGYNDRELCVNYPTWEQMIDRFSHITSVIEADLKAMGNEQFIASVKMNKHNNKYQIIYTLKPSV